jgi:hypothetical protein
LALTRLAAYKAGRVNQTVDIADWTVSPARTAALDRGRSLNVYSSEMGISGRLSVERASEERVVRVSDQDAAAAGAIYPRVTHGHNCERAGATRAGGPEAALHAP